MMITYIYWIAGQAKTVKGEVFLERYAIDTDYDDDESKYGMFTEEGGWMHIPFKDFPAEFKAQLLLLGLP